MELESQNVKQTYIILLVQTLQKKLGVMNELLRLTLQQEKLISSDNMKEEDFLQLISQKEEQLGILLKLDDGFEKLYQSVKEELFLCKEKYTSEISSLKENITNITDVSVKLQAIEKRNKTKIEQYFSDRRKDIRSSRISNKTVANYYKTMTNQQQDLSFFYDKKK